MLVIASFFVIDSAQADYKRNYTNGLNSYENADYNQAIQSLQRAIDEEPVSQYRVKMFGMRFVSYLPYFYLGQAKHQLKDCKGALEAWTQSLTQGVIQDLEEYSDLQRGFASCESTMPLSENRFEW